MAELLVKIAYTVFKLKVVLNFLLWKVFIYISILISICSCKLYWQYPCRSWWSSDMIPENVTWVQFSARISTAYSKILPINGLVFQFLIKHLHVCCYKFSYRISDQDISPAMLYKYHITHKLVSTIYQESI